MASNEREREREREREIGLLVDLWQYIEVVIHCRFSSLCFRSTTECVFCVVIMFICLSVFLIFAIGILRFVSKLFIDGLCVVDLAPATRTISGAMFHPLIVMLLMSG